jgi:hypothetical protein
MNTIFKLIIIGACVGAFFMFVVPKYEAIKETRATINGYDASLATADRLKTSREELIAKYNNISKADLDGIKTLLPDSVDNIRLIIQLDGLATKNGLSTLRNVDYKSEQKPVATGTVARTTTVGGPVDINRRPYGELEVSFVTTGQYANFLAFISDLEQNLRLVDIRSVDFGTAGTNENSAGAMSYKVTLKTYWLKQ